jgi:hypothetical protein
VTLHTLNTSTSLRNVGPRTDLELAHRVTDSFGVHTTRPPYELAPDFEAQCRELRSALEFLHQRYIGSVSTEPMALSLESAAAICVIVRCTLARTVLDLGSGFSSAALRLAREKGLIRSDLEIYSVDDEPLWLEKTRDFLRQQSLPTDNLVAWSALVERIPDRQFDVVSHDLGGMRTRRDTLVKSWEFVAQDGFWFLGDMHKDGFRDHLTTMLARMPHVRYDVDAVTRDHYGRFAWLVNRLDAPVVVQ